MPQQQRSRSQRAQCDASASPAALVAMGTGRGAVCSLAIHAHPPRPLLTHMPVPVATPRYDDPDAKLDTLHSDIVGGDTMAEALATLATNGQGGYECSVRTWSQWEWRQCKGGNAIG